MGIAPLSARADFPLEGFPVWARGYVEQLAHVLQVDAVVPALSVMGATAIAVQRKAEIHVRGGWKEQLAFWSFPTLRSGNRKTPALVQPMAPLYRFEREENTRRAAYRARLQAAAERIDPKAPGRRERERALKEAAPPDLELFGTDATPEALALALAEQNEAYAVVTDEPTSLALILQGLYAEGRGANTGILMAGYSGSPYRRRRVKSPSAALRRPALSLVLIGQPRVFAELTSAENLVELGFVGRLLIAQPHDRLGEREVHGEAIPEAVLEEFRVNFLTILLAPDRDPLPDLAADVAGDPPTWPRGPRERWLLTLTEEARALHLEAETRIEPLLREGALLGELSDFGAKLAGLMARAAALVHVLHRPDDWWRHPVGAETAACGVEIGRYALGQLLAIYSTRAQQERDTALAAFVLERARRIASNGSEPPTVTWRALARALVSGNGRGKIRDADALRGVVELLVERGDLVRDRAWTRGERYLLRQREGGACRDADREEARA